MADKEIHHVQSDGGAGIGLVAGILAVVLIGLGLIFYAGGFDFGGDKDVNVNIDAPKIDTPGGDGKPG